MTDRESSTTVTLALAQFNIDDVLALVDRLKRPISNRSLTLMATSEKHPNSISIDQRGVMVFEKYHEEDVARTHMDFFKKSELIIIADALKSFSSN